MSSETSAQRQRILVIDDDFDIREVLRDRLQARGFDVVAAGSGHHGLALIGDHVSKGCQIDGILLNWKMPGLRRHGTSEITGTARRNPRDRHDRLVAARAVRLV